VSLNIFGIRFQVRVFLWREALIDFILREVARGTLLGSLVILILDWKALGLPISEQLLQFRAHFIIEWKSLPDLEKHAVDLRGEVPEVLVFEKLVPGVGLLGALQERLQVWDLVVSHGGHFHSK